MNRIVHARRPRPIEAATRGSPAVADKPDVGYQLDFHLTGDFMGGGITFSMPFGKASKPCKGTSSP